MSRLRPACLAVVIWAALASACATPSEVAEPKRFEDLERGIAFELPADWWLDRAALPAEPDDEEGAPEWTPIAVVRAPTDPAIAASPFLRVLALARASSPLDDEELREGFRRAADGLADLDVDAVTAVELAGRPALALRARGEVDGTRLFFAAWMIPASPDAFVLQAFWSRAADGRSVDGIVRSLELAARSADAPGSIESVFAPDTAAAHAGLPDVSAASPASASGARAFSIPSLGLAGALPAPWHRPTPEERRHIPDWDALERAHLFLREREPTSEVNPVIASLVFPDVDSPEQARFILDALAEEVAVEPGSRVVDRGTVEVGPHRGHRIRVHKVSHKGGARVGVLYDVWFFAKDEAEAVWVMISASPLERPDAHAEIEQILGSLSFSRPDATD